MHEGCEVSLAVVQQVRTSPDEDVCAREAATRSHPPRKRQHDASMNEPLPNQPRNFLATGWGAARGWAKQGCAGGAVPAPTSARLDQDATRTEPPSRSGDRRRNAARWTSRRWLVVPRGRGLRGRRPAPVVRRTTGGSTSCPKTFRCVRGRVRFARLRAHGRLRMVAAMLGC